MAIYPLIIINLNQESEKKNKTQISKFNTKVQQMS